MQRKLIVPACTSLLALACSFSPTPADSAVDVDFESEAKPAKTAKWTPDKAIEASGDEAIPPLARRDVGDFFVHRFTGTYTKIPVVLSEEVTAKRGSLIVIEYTLEEGKRKTRLSVTHDMDTARILGVRKVIGDKTEPATVAEFESMMKKTVFVPDSNDKRLASQDTTCLVAGEEVDCIETTYQVSVGEETAQLTVTTSDQFSGRDLAGEIATKDGKIIYRAELIDSGKGGGDSVATR